MGPFAGGVVMPRSATDAALAELYRESHASLSSSSSSATSTSLGGVGDVGAASSMSADDPRQPHPLLTEKFMLKWFKIAPCPRNEVHDWSLCPYSHVGEKAQRRNPFLENGEELYTGIACPSMKSVRFVSLFVCFFVLFCRKRHDLERTCV